MKPFLLSTDSGCDLDAALCREMDISVLPMEYEINSERFYETSRPEELAAFYQKMAEGAVVHTSSVNIADYLRFFEPMLDQGLPIIHICLGSGISSSYQNALLARQELELTRPDAKIYIVDSLGASLVYGMQVLHAAQLRDEGVRAEDVFEDLLEYRHHISPYYTTGNLEYLYRGGRVSRSGLFIAKTLNIWPILNLSASGELKVIDRAKGRRRAFSQICTRIAEFVEDPEAQTLYICHSDAPEMAREFAEMIQKQFGFRDIFYAQIGATIGAHTGPGLVSAFFYGKPRK
ncbi:MAG: DegV family protein [Clostridia bacterium]|nr:DegV family protein [Clostridia bacterium]